jgi:serine/threonine protein kinase
MVSPPIYPSGAPLLSLTPPFLLGQYQVVEKIGRGGMGAVYRALHPLLKKELAVKILPPEATADERAVARFRREMEAIGRLDDPHIVRATDAGEAGGIHFLVMELVDGIDLTRLVRYCSPLPVADACDLVRQAALGLQCAHEHGLVHRDIKPSNLVLSRKGVVKVLDLGLALLSRVETGSPEMTANGQVMGTADYMAPEQWEASHDVDIRADIYSLGCTLYTLLVGKPPFSGGEYATPMRKMTAHAKAPVPLAAVNREDVPESLKLLLARLAAKSPDDRPATPAAAALALEPFARGADLAALAERALSQASPGQPAPPDRPTLPESDRLLTASPEVPLAVTPTAHPPASARRKRGAVAIAAGVVLVTVTAAVAALGLWLWGHKPPPPKPGGWQNLLTAAPKERFWPPSDIARLDFDPRKEVLWIDHPTRALIPLGTTDARSYKLQIGFRQALWVGGFGVYFGGRRGDAPFVFRLQMVELLSPPRNGPQSFRLERGIGLIRQEKPNDEPGLRTQGTASWPLKEPPDTAEQILELLVKPDGLAAVRWNGEPCPALVTAHPAQQAGQEGIGCQGEFGICCLGSSVKITTARFLPLE